MPMIMLVAFAALGCTGSNETNESTSPPEIIGEDFLNGLTLPNPNAPKEEKDSLSAPVEELDADDGPPLVVLLDGNNGEFGSSEGGEQNGEEGGEQSEEPLLELPKMPLPESLGEGFIDISGEMLTDGRTLIEKGTVPDVDLPEVSHGIFADLNQDGVFEVIIDAAACCTEGHYPVVYRYEADQDSLVYDADLQALLPDIKFGPVAAWVDLDGNGHEDILTSRAEEMIFLADGNGGWGEALSMPPPPNYPDFLGEFRAKGAINIADLDDNGLLDIIIGDSNCEEGSGILAAFIQITPGIFVERADFFQQDPSGDPYAVMATPLGPPGEFVVQALGRSCTNAEPYNGFYRRSGLDSEGYPTFESFDPTPLESEYKETSAVSFGPFTTVNPMGATVGDLSLDGILDLVATHSTPTTTSWTVRGLTPAPTYAFFQGLLEWPFYDRSVLSDTGPPAGLAEYNMIPWGIALVDLNRDGLGDLVTAHGPDASGVLDPTHWVGPQITTVHLATGLFTFGDVTELSGIDREGHWHGLTMGDLDGDGSPDFIVGGYGELPRVYRNELDVPNNGLAIRLKGQLSNAVGHGATLVVEGEQSVPARTLLMGHMGSPNGISSPIVFAGLGPATQAKKTTIRWPSGYIQEVLNLAANTLHVIEEPDLAVFTPPSRRGVADGNSTLSLLITPRHPDGSLNLDTTVEVNRVYGEGSLASTAPTEEGWTVFVKAPSKPGFTVLEIIIGGTPLKVRPRIVWDAP